MKMVGLEAHMPEGSSVWLNFSLFAEAILSDSSFSTFQITSLMFSYLLYRIFSEQNFTVS
jgi:hypothetical protein